MSYSGFVTRQKEPQMQIQIGQIVENKLSNGQVIVVRVMEFITSVGMWRVTDACETRPDAWLVEHNRTWAVPLENLGPRYIAHVTHKDGLVPLFVDGVFGEIVESIVANAKT